MTPASETFSVAFQPISSLHIFSSRPELLRKLANHYHRSPGIAVPDRDGFQRWIADAYHRLPLRVQFVDHDPYHGLNHMKAETDSTGILKITTRNNESVLDPQVNLMFRAVHDSDHIRYLCDFGAAGELRACRIFSSRCGDEMGRALLFSEIAGQACVAVVNGTFDEQKFVWYPRSWRDEALRI